MDLLEKIWGSGTDLSALQMGSRGIVVFIIALALIRISGRRSFGVRTPLDNIIVILLGAVLSRAVVGASPFVPVMVTSFLIVLLHRGLAWLIASFPGVSRWAEGKKMLLYHNGRFDNENLKRALVCEEDVLQGARESALTDDLSTIERIYMERNGGISCVEKKDQ